MIKTLSSALLALTTAALFAVPADQTDLPNAYGEQLKNSTFEGEWNENNEPTDGSWHSFQTGKYGGVGSGAKNKDQFQSDKSVLCPVPNGSGSALITAKNVLSNIANGTVTTGQVNATVGVFSITADKNNFTKCFNKSIREDGQFNTPFASKPDSVTVWIKFEAASAQKGRISVILHGDIDMQDPASSKAFQDQVAGVAALQFTPHMVEGVNSWVRLSIPFQYDTYESYKNFTDCRLSDNTQTYNVAKIDPKYIITTLSTNIIPGGAASDKMWFDNFLMIYNPTLTLGTVSPTSYTKGETIAVPYTLEGTMSPYNSLEAKNKVILQLSDANGSFTNPTVLSEVETDVSGIISANIPTDITDGTAYRVRIVTTNYPMTSEDNGTDISISTSTAISSQIVATANISPNPAQDIIEISNFDIAQAEIFNLQGQCVWSVSAVGGNRIDISMLPVGSYILQVRSTDGQVARTKLLINR